jgi:hypothetical protein
MYRHSWYPYLRICPITASTDIHKSTTPTSSTSNSQISREDPRVHCKWWWERRTIAWTFGVLEHCSQSTDKSCS